MLSGMMRRLNLVLLASLQLCRARQPGFSIHDDMLAYPQVKKPLLSFGRSLTPHADNQPDSLKSSSQIQQFSKKTRNE